MRKKSIFQKLAITLSLLLSLGLWLASGTTLAANKGGLPALAEDVHELKGQVKSLLKTYAIGDTGPAGGKVFYTTNNGLHGLEAAPEDQSDDSHGNFNVHWGSIIPLVGASGTTVGAGARNTDVIVLSQGDDRSANQGVFTAAQIAATYNLNGYIDWFLPSKAELNLMYENQAKLFK